MGPRRRRRNDNEVDRSSRPIVPGLSRPPIDRITGERGVTFSGRKRHCAVISGRETSVLKDRPSTSSQAPDITDDRLDEDRSLDHLDAGDEYVDDFDEFLGDEDDEYRGFFLGQEDQTHGEHIPTPGQHIPTPDQRVPTPVQRASTPIQGDPTPSEGAPRRRGKGKGKGKATDDSWLVKGPVAGGPFDDSVIPSFRGHISSKYPDDVRGCLKLQNRGKLCKVLSNWLGSMTPDRRATVEATGLTYLTRVAYEHLDWPLISGFVDRWQPDTNSFHLPFGEMTITLHDVFHILRIPVEGVVVGGTEDIKRTRLIVSSMLNIDLDRVTCDKNLMKGFYVHPTEIKKYCDSKRTPETETLAWIWVMLASTLFPDTSGNLCYAGLLHPLDFDVPSVRKYSWGSATLANLYRKLGIASRGDSKGLSGCLTLLQAWIYEYFPMFRPAQGRRQMPDDQPRAMCWLPYQSHDEDRLEVIRRQIDQLTAAEITWLPYGDRPWILVPRTLYCGLITFRGIVEPYMPERVVRQFGLVQGIPPPIMRPTHVCRPWKNPGLCYEVTYCTKAANDSWRRFPIMHHMPIEKYTEISTIGDNSAYSDDYTDWYRKYCRPLLRPTGWDSRPPPRSNTHFWLGQSVELINRLVELDLPGEATTLLQAHMERWNSANY